MSTEVGGVGVVAGLSLELRLLRHPGGGVRRPLAYTSAYGVGPERASEAAHSLLAGGARALVSWGTAAALAPELAPGCIVLPEAILGSDGQRYSSAGDWQGRVYRALEGRVPLDTGPLQETFSVLRGRREKAALGRRWGARAADMESAAVAEAARGAGVPFLVVRAIVDSAGAAVPECVVRATRPEGTLALGTLLAGALAHPSQIMALVPLALGFRAGRRGLRRVARLAGAELLCP